MARETEYKFIATYIPEKWLKRKISQGYIHIDPFKQVRVRLYWDTRKAYMCVKFMDGNHREEFETEMDFREGCELFALCKYRLTKNRYSTLYGNYGIDVDEYENGILTVEVEVRNDMSFDEKELAYLRKTFPFIGENVDGKWEYNNYSIAGFPKEEYL
jgi:CYTH domain-containing protein